MLSTISVVVARLCTTLERDASRRQSVIGEAVED